MIVQACLNGARPPGYHPSLPLTPEAMAHDARLAVGAGAAELHIHPRDEDGKESLFAVSRTVSAVRRTCPGTLVGVSTGAWIERDEERTRAALGGWDALPDYASVNLSEADAPAVMALLRQRGVGIEAGLASPADASRLVSLSGEHRPFRILVEIEEQDVEVADGIIRDIAAIIAGDGIECPVLLHGFDATVWHFVAEASERRWSTRVGLEDGDRLPDGRVAPDNAALVAAAVNIFRQGRS